MENRSSEQWQKIEGSAREAEKSERKRLLSAVELNVEKNNGGSEIIDELKKEEGEFTQEVEDILGSEDSPERALVALQRENLWKALRENRKLELEEEGLRQKEIELLKDINEAREKGKPTRGKAHMLEKTRQSLVEIEGKEKELLESSPEAYFGLHLKDLKEYKKDLKGGSIVETPYVKEQIKDITSHLQAGKPVMIYGHLGSGKTELAMHIAKKMGKSALVISGSKHTSLSEMYGHQTLSIDKINKDELDGFAKEVEQKFNEWLKENPQAKGDEKNRAHDRILQIYLTQFKGGTISDFFVGPIYRAMAEGRPVIIDEVNAIPHEVLISLNHILTRKVGDKLNIQQNSGTEMEVKEGYGVMMTGNLNQGQEKYIDRQDMDPAFLSRLYKLEYAYLPQKTEGSLEDAAGEKNELFQLLLAEVMDKNGNIEIPRDSIKKLWNLAKAARVTQDVFAGKEINNAYYFQEAGNRAVKYLLKESVMSIRAIDNILEQWKKEGYEKEIDYYIWKEFVSQSTVASDKAYLYQLLKDRFGFFQNEGWPQSPNYGAGGMVSSFDIKTPKNFSAEKEFFGPRDTVEFAFGKAPERAKWPETKEEGMPETEVVKNELTDRLMDLEKMGDICKGEIEKLETMIGESISASKPAESAPETVKQKRGFFSGIFK